MFRAFFFFEHGRSGINELMAFIFYASLVDLRINETLQTGAVRKPHLPGDESIYLFFEFTNVSRAIFHTLRIRSIPSRNFLDLPVYSHYNLEVSCVLKG